MKLIIVVIIYNETVDQKYIHVTQIRTKHSLPLTQIVFGNTLIDIKTKTLRRN